MTGGFIINRLSVKDEEKLMNYDLVIANANVIFPLGYQRELLDFGIRDGRIHALKKRLTSDHACRVIDVGGRIVSPSFVEIHASLDTFGTYSDSPASDLFTSGQKMTENLITSDSQLESRLEKMVRHYVLNGTTTIRSKVSTRPSDGLFNTLSTACDKLAPICDVEFGVPARAWTSMNSSSYSRTLLDAPRIADDWTGFNPNWREAIDEAFELGRKKRLRLAFEIFSGGVEGLRMIEYIADRVLMKKDYPLYEWVTLSYLQDLGDTTLYEDQIQMCMYKCAKANIHVATMPSNELFFGSGNRRGLTRLNALIDAGVNVSISSGHSQDDLYPFGMGNLLEEVLVAAQAYKFGTVAGLRKLFELITYNPARALMLRDYGVTPGCRADLVVLDSKTAEDAIVDQAKVLYVIRDGVVIVEDFQLNEVVYAL